jgi:hypothetical protein
MMPVGRKFLEADRRPRSDECQLPSEGTQLGTKNGVITVQQAQPLEAVREILAERGGIRTPVRVFSP